MKNLLFSSLFILTAFLSNAQSEIYVDHVTNAWYTGPVTAQDFDTHDFVGEMLEFTPMIDSEVVIDLHVENQSGGQVEWRVSRTRVAVDTAWDDFLCWGHETDLFGGICIPSASMDTNVWVGATGGFLTTLEVGEAGLLAVHIIPDGTTSGCGHYRYYVGDSQDPYMDSVDVMVCYSLGIDEQNEIELSIAPNPANDLLKISGASGDLTLINAVGQIVYEEKLVAKTIIDVNEFDAGVYFAVLQTENGERIQKKIIVE